MRGHRQNFTMGGSAVASDGWLGLSGRHGQRGARRSRGVARQNRALPARDRAWWNWLAARAGASSEFYEGSQSRREAVPPTVPSPCVARPLWNWQRPYSVGPPRRPWPPERPGHPPEATGRVHDGIGALPNGIGLCPLTTVPARAGNGGTGSPPLRGYRQNFTKALRAAGRPPGGLRWVARPL